MEQPISELSTKINKDYRRYTFLFANSTQTVNTIIESLDLVLEHPSETEKDALKNEIRVASLEQTSFASHHIIRSLATSNKEYKKNQITKAENHCQMSVVITYMAAISSLISTHNYYIELYKDFIERSELNIKLKKIGIANFLYEELTTEIKKSSLKRVSIEQQKNLKDAFEECLYVVKCHKIFEETYKNKKHGAIQPLRKKVLLYGGAGVGITGGVFSSLSNNHKEGIVQYILNQTNHIIQIVKNHL